MLKQYLIDPSVLVERGNLFSTCTVPRKLCVWTVYHKRHLYFKVYNLFQT